MDINTKKLKKNAFRITKERGITASRVRVPGGHLDAELLGKIQEISEKYGNGKVHITSRQGFEILGIKFEHIDAVNEMLQPIIDKLEINQEDPGTGYSAAGTRNPNDCAKVRMHDFGIIGMTEPQYDESRCINCQACLKACKKLSVGALSSENYKIVRNTEKCIGCGVCVEKCPTRAFTRSKEKYYKLTIMGRTGKKNPRLGQDFIIWADEESIIKIISNTYKFTKEYIAKDAPGGKEHVGYIVDRVGFHEFKKWALDGVELGEKAIVKENVYWGGIHFNSVDNQ